MGDSKRKGEQVPVPRKRNKKFRSLFVECVSFLRRGHVELPHIVPVLSDVCEEIIVRDSTTEYAFAYSVRHLSWASCPAPPAHISSSCAETLLAPQTRTPNSDTC